MGGVVESAGGFLGLGEGKDVAVKNASSGLDTLTGRSEWFRSPGAMEAMRRYASGDLSLEEAMKASPFSQDDYGARQKLGYNDALATDSQTGSRFATDQVMSNPIMSQLFGKGGALQRANTEEQDLASRGFQLKPEDIEAYGQASGNIARLFGQGEQDLTQSLASRGLASAPSGAAGLGFSGLQGNKMEQLARAQTDIANKRMENNLQRLNQTRGFLSQLGGQGASAIQDQYGRQLQGAQYGQGMASTPAGLQLGSNEAENSANMNAAKFKKATTPKNFMDFATAGFGQGLQSAASGAFTGGASPSSFGGVGRLQNSPSAGE